MDYLNLITKLGYFFSTFYIEEEVSFYLRDNKWILLINKEESIIIEKDFIFEYIELLKINKKAFIDLLYLDILSYAMMKKLDNSFFNDFLYKKILKYIPEEEIDMAIDEFENSLKYLLKSINKNKLSLIKS